MVLGYVETLFHSFTYGNAWHYDDKLCPTVAFVQLKHRLDIDVCLTGTGLHFYIELAGSKALYHLIAKVDVVLCLYLMDVLQQLILRKHYLAVLVACVIPAETDAFLLYALAVVNNVHLSLVHLVVQETLVGLSVKDVDGAFHGIGLILLFLELQFHPYKIFVVVLGAYVLKTCSKFVAVASSTKLVSRSTAYVGCIFAMAFTTSSETSWSKQATR